MKKRIFSLAAAFLIFATFFTGCKTKFDVGAYNYDLNEYVTLPEINTVISREEFDKRLKEEYEGYATYETTYGGTGESADGIKVQKGDTANIDYMGKENGVAFQGGTAKGTDLEIGSNSFIAGFEDGLIGVGVGETVDLNLKFPDSYHSPDMAGKSVVFTVTVNYIKRPTVAEYNEENAKKYTGYTIAEFEKRTAGIIIFDKVYEGATVKSYPEKELQATKQKYIDSYKEVAASYNMTFDKFLAYYGYTEATFDTYALNTAKNYVKRDLMIYKIISDNPELQLDEKQYEEESKKLWETMKEGGSYKESYESFQKANDKLDIATNIYLQRVTDYFGEIAEIK